VVATFIQLHDQDISAVVARWNRYIKAQTAPILDPIASFLFDPLSNIALHAYKVRNASPAAARRRRDFCWEASPC
jgi:hypothetical protein